MRVRRAAAPDRHLFSVSLCKSSLTHLHASSLSQPFSVSRSKSVQSHIHFLERLATDKDRLVEGPGTHHPCLTHNRLFFNHFTSFPVGVGCLWLVDFPSWHKCMSKNPPPGRKARPRTRIGWWTAKQGTDGDSQKLQMTMGVQPPRWKKLQDERQREQECPIFNGRGH